jgi:hypothetical protein
LDRYRIALASFLQTILTPNLHAHTGTKWVKAIEWLQLAVARVSHFRRNPRLATEITRVFNPCSNLWKLAASKERERWSAPVSRERRVQIQAISG